MTALERVQYAKTQKKNCFEHDFLYPRVVLVLCPIVVNSAMLAGKIYTYMYI